MVKTVDQEIQEKTIAEIILQAQQRCEKEKSEAHKKTERAKDENPAADEIADLIKTAEQRYEQETLGKQNNDTHSSNEPKR